MELFIVILAIQAFTFGGFTSYLARAKGYDEGRWFTLGFLFSFVALVTMCGLPVKQKTEPKPPTPAT